MARYTKSYSSFTDSLQEVETLCGLARDKELDDPLGDHEVANALVRGAIVLLSSHIEAYVRELGETAILSLYLKNVPRHKLPSRFFYHVSKGILSELKNTNNPERIADKVFGFLESDHIGYWSKDGVFPSPVSVEGFNRGFSNPRFSKICDYFKRFGYSTFDHDLKRSLQGSFPVTIGGIDHLVDTRNAIAHGDRQQRKTATEAVNFIAFAREFCRETDRLFASWWRDKYCSIR